MRIMLDTNILISMLLFPDVKIEIAGTSPFELSFSHYGKTQTKRMSLLFLHQQDMMARWKEATFFYRFLQFTKNPVVFWKNFQRILSTFRLLSAFSIEASASSVSMAVTFLSLPQSFCLMVLI